MDAVVPGTLPSHREAFNRCCMYLQVVNLSEIMNGYGDLILPQTLQGTRAVVLTNPYKFPYQPKPPKVDWEVWRALLHPKFTFRSTNFMLHRPLGAWHANQQVQWKHSMVENQLYHWDHTGLQ